MNLDMKKFKDDLWSGRMTRRDFKRSLAAVGLSMTAVPLAGRRAAADPEGEPVFYLWAGYEVPEILPAYYDKYGHGPEYSLFGDEDEALAKMAAGFKPDITFPCSYKVQKWYDSGFLGPIDTSRLSNWNDIFPSLRAMDVVTINDETVWVPVDWGQTSVLFRTDLAPEYVGNHSWKILWDPKYAGRLAMFDSLIDGVAVAAILAGVDPFGFGPGEDMEKVRALLKEQLPLLRFYTNDMTSVEQALASGELIAAATWNSSYATMKREGYPVEFMNPKEGAMTWVCGLSLIRGTEFVEKAHEVIDAILDPRSRSWETVNWGYGGSTMGGFAMVDDETLAGLGLPRDPDILLKSGIFQAPMKFEAEISTMFEEVKAGV
jgi:spermidine/putrescine transport system substrate-binding protein